MNANEFLAALQDVDVALVEEAVSPRRPRRGAVLKGVAAAAAFALTFTAVFAVVRRQPAITATDPTTAAEASCGPHEEPTTQQPAALPSDTETDRPPVLQTEPAQSLPAQPRETEAAGTRSASEPGPSAAESAPEPAGTTAPAVPGQTGNGSWLDRLLSGDGLGSLFDLPRGGIFGGRANAPTPSAPSADLPQTASGETDETVTDGGIRQPAEPTQSPTRDAQTPQETGASKPQYAPPFSQPDEKTLAALRGDAAFRLKADKTEVLPGDTVTVTVGVRDAHALTSVDLSLRYDPAALSYVSREILSAAQLPEYSMHNKGNEIRFAAFSPEVVPDCSCDLFAVRFRVSEDAVGPIILTLDVTGFFVQADETRVGSVQLKSLFEPETITLGIGTEP